jgi:DNA mismatch repair protein MutS2
VGAAAKAPEAAPVRAAPAPARADDTEPGGDERCDLRGLRVEEAIERLVYALDRAAAAGRRSLVIVHGVGTGALRDAVRRHLAESPYVAAFEPGSPTGGGDGATTARLA